MRQDDHAAHGQPDDRADLGHHLGRRPGHLDGRRGPAAPRHRLRHPARRPVPAPHRRRQRRDRPEAARLGRQASRRPRARSCWTGSGWTRPSPTATPASSPADSSSGSAWPGRSPPTRPVMLMDEPFSAVDPVVREQLQDEFLRLQRELGKTILFVTHDIDEAVKLADLVAILRVGGQLAQVAEPARLLSRPGRRLRRRLRRARPRLPRPGLPGRPPTCRSPQEPTVTLGATRGAGPGGDCGPVAPRRRHRRAPARLGRARPADPTGRQRDPAPRRHRRARRGEPAGRPRRSPVGTVRPGRARRRRRHTARHGDRRARPRGAARRARGARHELGLGPPRRHRLVCRRARPARRHPARRRPTRRAAAGLGRPARPAPGPARRRGQRAALHHPEPGPVHPHAAAARHQDPRRDSTSTSP